MGWRSNDSRPVDDWKFQGARTAPQVMRAQFRCVVWSSTVQSIGRLLRPARSQPQLFRSLTNDDRLRLRRDGPARLDQHGGGAQSSYVYRQADDAASQYVRRRTLACPTGRRDVPKPPLKTPRCTPCPARALTSRPHDARSKAYARKGDVRKADVRKGGRSGPRLYDLARGHEYNRD